MTKMRHFSLHLLMLCSFFSKLYATNITLQNVLRSKRTQRFARPYEAIYQFGDSLSDTGNVILEANGERLQYARLPYGQTYFHRPTGRCSDGLLMVDYFSMYFHLPLLNPYLARGSNFFHGANFAVAGATALCPSALAVKDVILPRTHSCLYRQLAWFKSLMHISFSHSREVKAKLQKSLVLMGEIGGNDYNYAFFQGRTMEQVYQLVPDVVQTIKFAVQELIDLGATNIVVPGNFPIGCVPLYLVRFQTNDASKYDQLQCLWEYNDFSRYHNKVLIGTIQELQQRNPGLSIAYGDYYNALIWVITHASWLGFEPNGTQKVCCAIGHNSYNYDLQRSCGSPGVPICGDPSKTVSWDGIHMTQEANKDVARFLLRQFLPRLKKYRRH